MMSVTYKPFTLSVNLLSVIYAECHTQATLDECHYAECCYAECRCAFHLAQFRKVNKV